MPLRRRALEAFRTAWRGDRKQLHRLPTVRSAAGLRVDDRHQDNIVHAPTSTAEVADVLMRPAVHADALCLSVLAMQVFLDTYATEGIRPAIAREVLSGYSEATFIRAISAPRSRLCVAERNGHLVGFAQVTLGAEHELAPGGPQAELLRLYVQERFTGQKLGTRLLARAEQLASDEAATVLWLTPWVHNHRALAFYLRRGYQDFGLTRFVFEGESHENRVLAKHLPDARAA